MKMVEKQNRELILEIKIHDLKPGEEIPKIAMYLLDARGAVKEKVASVVKGKLTLDPALATEKRRILALGPDVEDLREISRSTLMQFRIGDQWPIWKKAKVVEIPRDWWASWPPFRVCVSGMVRKCWPIILDPFPRPSLGGIALRVHPPLFQHCSPICNGVAEIYEVECCCPTLTTLDIVSDILEKLRRIIELRPPKVWPPFPPFPPYPPPPPYEQIGPRPTPNPGPALIDKGALRKLKRVESFGLEPLKLEQSSHLLEDIRALETLPKAEAIKYVREKSHLWPFWCTCHERKLGEAILGPDGHFTFCYKRMLYRLLGRHCRTMYFYKVKQWHENQWVYIYDGSASYEYFTADQFAYLKTWLGRACIGDDPEIPDEGAYVMLQDIGSTDSWRLVSHWLGKDAAGNDLTQDGENSVATPPDNGGLANPPAAGPSPIPANPVTTPKPGHHKTTNPGSWFVNQPWGGTLSFRLFFNTRMKNIGACYYRISIIQAGADGKPVPGETPIPLTNPISWLKFVSVSGQIQIQAESLGPMDPNTVGGNVGLYRIPYREDAAWLEGQYHQHWNTMWSSNGRHLLAIEVFDSNGQRLKPIGAAGTGKQENFNFLRWLEETGSDSVAKVPFAKLMHLFWFDNLPCYADIVDLRKDHSPSTEECQFLAGMANSEFSIGFRAFHSTRNSITPPETFMWYYTIWHHRGLNGPDVAIETGGRNTPASLDSGSPSESASQTFEEMLGTGEGGEKCTFAINLWVYAKHTNGSRRLHEYDRFDQAAFALEILP